MKMISHILILSLSISEISKANANLENSQDVQPLDQVSDVLQMQTSQDSGVPLLDRAILGLIPRVSPISSCEGGFCLDTTDSPASSGERIMIYEKSNCIWAATGTVGRNGKILLDRQNTNVSPQDGDLALLMGQDADIVAPIPCSYRS